MIGWSEADLERNVRATVPKVGLLQVDRPIWVLLVSPAIVQNLSLIMHAVLLMLPLFTIRALEDRTLKYTWA